MLHIVSRKNKKYGTSGDTVYGVFRRKFNSSAHLFCLIIEYLFYLPISIKTNCIPLVAPQ